MAQNVELPSENDRQEFARSLAQFRGTLSPTGQRMLDTMASAAFLPKDQEAVQGYTHYWHEHGPQGAGWYERPNEWAWENSQWGWHWRNVYQP
jgi:hypothetical protein